MMNKRKLKNKIPGPPPPPGRTSPPAPPLLGMSPPPPPLASGKRAGASLPPIPGSIPTTPSSKDNFKNKPSSGDISELESRLALEREELFSKLKEKELENRTLQEKFLEKEKAETLKRKKDLDDLRRKLEIEHLNKEKKVEAERKKWETALEEMRKEAGRLSALEKTEELIRQQAKKETEKEYYKDLKELKSQLDQAQKQIYEERIKKQEEEKNSIKVEQALREVIEGVTKNKKVEETFKEKEDLKKQIVELEKNLIEEKAHWSKILQESENQIDNLRLDFQSRLNQKEADFEAIAEDLRRDNRELKNRLWQLQNEHEARRSIWDTRLKDKTAENEKLISGFQRELSEYKYSSAQALASAQSEKENALKELELVAEKYEETRIDMRMKISALEKEKDFLEKESALKIGLLNEKLREGQAEVSQQKTLYAEKINVLASEYNLKENALKEKFALEELETEKEISRLKNKHADQILLLERENQSLREKMHSTEKEYAKLKLEYEKTLSAGRLNINRSDNEVGQMREKFENKIESIEADYKSKIAIQAETIANLKTRVFTLREEKDKREEKFEKELSALRKLLFDAEKATTEYQGVHKRLDDELKTSQKEIEVLKNHNANLNSKVLSLNKSNGELAYSHQEELRKLNEDKDLSIRELKVKYSKKIQGSAQMLR
ncbi:MAG: hypothetical protein GX817_00710 [Elusimicrobia bacterium]|nr:hypothetical protein [Elusimicrobiota bacterium]